MDECHKHNMEPKKPNTHKNMRNEFMHIKLKKCAKLNSVV